MKVGFIGLGNMGSLMAENLLKKGNQLIVYNRTKEKAAQLVARGAVLAESAAKVAEGAPVVLTMLSDPTAVADVALGKDGLLDHMQKGALWIDCSTVNPSFSRKMAGECVTRALRFLDAPVAGSKTPAEQGQLVFFVGGEESVFESVRPLLEAMGKAIFHIGGHGMGSAMKMVNNLLLGGAMSAFCEATVLGEALGIPGGRLFDILLASPLAAPYLTLKRSMFESGNFEAHFPLKYMHKDLQLASDTAYECGVAMPSSNATKELFALAAHYGLREEDFAAVYRYLKSSI